jgi:2-polyprenyl-3-methyl-5-hydroxy-6-metoxy-1,4-benzoquinol methylase
MGVAIKNPMVEAAGAAECPDVAASTEAYARRFRGSVGRWFLDVQLHSTLDLLRRHGRPLRIVDVGGGHGQLVPGLAAAGHMVEVVGSRPECGARLAPWLESGACTFRTAPLQQLPYADAEFDVAVSYRTVAHLTDWKKLVAELCRVARSSVLIDYPTIRSLNVLAEPLFALKLRLEGNTRRFRVFKPEEMAACFEEQGFSVTEVRPQFFLPMALHRAHGSDVVAGALEAVPRALGLTRTWGSPVILHAQRR